MRTRTISMTLLSLSISLAACTDEIQSEPPTCSGGKCDSPGVVDQTCLDPHYGDGVCQLQLSCAVPDIDCFEMFATDADAAVWFADFETRLAVEQQRAPRGILAANDPRFAHARSLLDRGWEAFRTRRPVGELGSRRPALVLIDDPNVNAFVVPDLATQQSVFSVHVQSGLLAAGATDDALLGVMMHELQHVVGLHQIGDTKDRVRTYYVAANGDEPIGHSMNDDSLARISGGTWRDLAGQVGPYATVELGGMSIAGELDQMFLAVIQSGLQYNPTGCAYAVELTNGLRSDIASSVDPFDSHLTIDLAQLSWRTTAALTALRNQCLPGFTRSFVEVAAALGQTTPQAVEANLTPHDRALVTGKHVIDAIAALIADRRAQMRDTQDAFERTTGEPWSALRYYSTEEDADDTSVTVLRGAQLDPAGNAHFMRSALSAETRARCDATLASGEVPAYGEDLTDEHHATCWRIYHLQTLAERARSRSWPAARTQSPATATARTSRLPLPRKLADQIVY
jgi:hypothetical protein